MSTTDSQPLAAAPEAGSDVVPEASPDATAPPATAEPDRAGGRSRVERISAVVETALIVIGLVVLTATRKPPMMGDGIGRYRGLLQLLEQHEAPAMPYSVIGPLFATPLWTVGRWYGNTEVWLQQYNLFLFLVALGTSYSLLRERMDPGLLRRFLLLLVAGSMVAPHVQDFYGEMFTAVTVGVGLLAATLPGTRRATRIAGWIAVALGVANTPATIVALVLVAVVFCVRKRRLRYLLVVPAAGALILAESWWRYGDPLHNAYATNGGGPTVMPYSGAPGFSYPLLLGLVAILFSFGKGLLWFTPGLFLPIRRRLSEAAGPDVAGLWTVWLLWTVFVAGLVLLYARWWGWNGGLYWGPRFFLIAVLPASLALAACLRSAHAGIWANLATLGAAVLSVWGALNSLVFGQVWPTICYQDDYRLEGLCHFTPEFSPLWFPLIELPDLSAQQLGDVVFYAVVLVWLTAPLVARITQQLAATLGPRRYLLSWRNWRF